MKPQECSEHLLLLLTGFPIQPTQRPVHKCLPKPGSACRPSAKSPGRTGGAALLVFRVAESLIITPYVLANQHKAWQIYYICIHFQRPYLLPTCYCTRYCTSLSCNVRGHPPTLGTCTLCGMGFCQEDAAAHAIHCAFSHSGTHGRSLHLM